MSPKAYVWNDGKFPDDIFEQDLFEKHRSKPYNPLIAQTFFKAGFIESWGRGFEKIKKESEEYGSPLPKVEINTAGVMIKCTPAKTYMELLNRMKDKNVSDNVSQNVSDNVSQNLKEIEEEIMKNIIDNPYITQQQMADKLKVNRKTIQRGLNSLKEKNIIERMGSDRKGHWEIIKR